MSEEIKLELLTPRDTTTGDDAIGFDSSGEPSRIKINQPLTDVELAAGTSDVAGTVTPKQLAGLGGCGAYHFINQGESGETTIWLTEDHFADGKRPYIYVTALGAADTLNIFLPGLANAVIGSEVYIHHMANELATVNVIAGSGVTLALEEAFEFSGHGLLVLRHTGSLAIGPTNVFKYWSRTFELNALPTSGGGSIALQQEGVEVVATADTLNFTDGLYVSTDGTVRTSLPATDAWTLSCAYAGPPEMIDPDAFGTQALAGTTQAGFTDVVAAGYGAVVSDGTYFEVTFPTNTATDAYILKFSPEVPAGALFLSPTSGVESVSISSSNGTISSVATDGTPSVSVANLGSLTIGIEKTSAGLYWHHNGARNLILGASDALAMSLLIGNMGGGAVAGSVDSDPSIPGLAAAGTVTLATDIAAAGIHPSTAFGAPDTPTLSQAQIDTGTDTTPSLITADVAAQLKNISVIGNASTTGGSDATTAVDQLRFINTGSDTSGRLRCSVSDTGGFTQAAIQFIDVASVTSAERTAGTVTDNRGFSPEDIRQMINTHESGIDMSGAGSAARDELMKYQGSFWMNSGGNASNTHFGDEVISTARPSTGVYELTTADRGVTSLMFNVQLYGGVAGDNAQVEHVSNTLRRISVFDAAGAPKSLGMVVTWNRLLI